MAANIILVYTETYARFQTVEVTLPKGIGSDLLNSAHVGPTRIVIVVIHGGIIHWCERMVLIIFSSQTL